MSKKLMIVLGVSLALNFLFIGFEVSRAIFEPPFPAFPEKRFHFRPDDLPPPPVAEARPDEGNRQGNVFFASFKKAMDEARQPMKISKQNVVEALRKDPFDPDALKKALEEASEVRRRIDQSVQDNMFSILSEMTPEERAAFADNFEKGPQFGKKADKGRFFHRRGEHRGAIMPPPEGMPYARRHRRPFHHNEVPPCMRDAPDEMDCPAGRPEGKFDKHRRKRPHRRAMTEETATPAPQESTAQ